MDKPLDRSPDTPKINRTRANESQRKYAATEKGAKTAKSYEATEKARARKRKYTYVMTPEQQEKQREAKRLSAQRRREKQRQKNFSKSLDVSK